MQTTVTINGLDTASAAIRAAVLDVGVPTALKTAGARGEALVKQNIASPYLGRANAIASGNLANSITFEATATEVTILAGAPADVYVDYVESGTGPHMPPVDAIALWVTQRMHISDAQQAMKIAWGVAKNIEKRGTLAFSMFARAFPVLEGELQGIFESAIADAIAAAGLA